MEGGGREGGRGTTGPQRPVLILSFDNKAPNLEVTKQGLVTTVVMMIQFKAAQPALVRLLLLPLYYS